MGISYLTKQTLVYVYVCISLMHTQRNSTYSFIYEVYFNLYRYPYTYYICTYLLICTDSTRKKMNRKNLHGKRRQRGAKLSKWNGHEMHEWINPKRGRQQWKRQIQNSTGIQSPLIHVPWGFVFNSMRQVLAGCLSCLNLFDVFLHLLFSYLSLSVCVCVSVSVFILLLFFIFHLYFFGISSSLSHLSGAAARTLVS